MNKVLPTIVAVLVAALLQAALASHLAIGNAVPNFLLLVVVTIAMVEGSGPGAAAGFSAGLVFDLLGSGPVGPMALVFSVIGYLTGSLSANVFAEGWLLPLTIVGIASLSAEVAYGLLLELLGDSFDFWRAFFTVMVPTAVYNAALALLVYPFLARFLRRDRPVRTFKRLA